jgi:hypothetical protein
MAVTAAIGISAIAAGYEAYSANESSNNAKQVEQQQVQASQNEQAQLQQTQTNNTQQAIGLAESQANAAKGAIAANAMGSNTILGGSTQNAGTTGQPSGAGKTLLGE